MDVVNCDAMYGCLGIRNDGKDRQSALFDGFFQSGTLDQIPNLRISSAMRLVFITRLIRVVMVMVVIMRVIMVMVMVMVVVVVMLVVMIVIVFMIVIMRVLVIVVVMIVVMIVVVVMHVVGVIYRMHKYVEPGPCDPLPVGFFDQKVIFAIQSKLGQAVTDRFRSRANIKHGTHEHVAADTGEAVQIKDAAHVQFPLAFSIWRPIVAAR